MEILLVDVIAKKNSVSVKESIHFSDVALVLDAEINGKFRISQQQEDLFSLDGTLRATVSTICDRCGAEMEFEVEQNYFYQLRIGAPPQVGSEYHCTDDDCEVLYLSEAVIDSETILREQLLLALPTSCLCVESCQGLCDRCGINLNEKKCKCREINENSPFAILKKLQ